MGFFDETTFDASTIEPAGDFKPIPEGDYPCIITAASEAPTKAGTGLVGVFSLQVASGEYKGRKLTKRVNLRNPNPTTVEIGQKELSAICRAINLMRPKGWQSFVGQTVTFHVTVRPYNDKLTNEVGGVVLGGDAPAAPVSPQSAGPAWG
jgi:hypothetical protein